MIAVIFEVWPKADGYDRYLEIATLLRTEVESMDGFLSIERFASLVEDGKILSLSFWRDEAAVNAWRHHMKHREAQQAGREQLFKDYRIRVASVVRDYSLENRAEAP